MAIIGRAIVDTNDFNVAKVAAQNLSKELLEALASIIKWDYDRN